MDIRYIFIFTVIDFSRHNLTSTDVRSQSDVYRRQILTTKVDPRAVRVKASLLEIKCVFKHFFKLYFTNVWSQIFTTMSNSYPLEVVGRGCETQLQVGKNYIFNFSYF